jgi:hypothetical protein
MDCMAGVGELAITFMRTELRFDYDEKMRPISGTCTGCGEKMPTPPCTINDSADIVMWLSQRYLEHRKIQHASEVDQSSQHS